MIIDHPHAIEAPLADSGAYAFRDEAILGTRLNMLLVADSFPAARAAALAARAEIDRLNGILNTRDPRSELALLNRSRVHRASPELFEVVREAERWRAATHGAYSARLGRALEPWRRAASTPPGRAELERLAHDAERAPLELQESTRTITRPDAVQFALDGFAKGWIVDRAFDVACTSPRVRGVLVDIGGDVRCGGEAPGDEGWWVGVADPRFPADNAPLVAHAHLHDNGVATSGRGPRDRFIAGAPFSQTISPHDGWPVAAFKSATVIAASAAAADALATALLVSPREEGIALAEALGVIARVANADREPVWSSSAQASAGRAHFTPIADRPSVADATQPQSWPEGWQALATFTAPRRQLIRDPSFRSPYMVMWITEADNAPVRTLLLVGKRPDWHKDNFIWWSMNRRRAEDLVAVRSMSTSGAGVYNAFWDGLDDAGRPVAAGKYVLHVETSRERGKHTHRSLLLDVSKGVRFIDVLPPTEEGGGLRVSFDRY